MFIIKIELVQGSVKILLGEYFFFKIVYNLIAILINGMKSDLNSLWSNYIYLQQLKEVLLSL